MRRLTRCGCHCRRLGQKQNLRTSTERNINVKQHMYSLPRSTVMSMLEHFRLAQPVKLFSRHYISMPSINVLQISCNNHQILISVHRLQWTPMKVRVPTISITRCSGGASTPAVVRQTISDYKFVAMCQQRRLKFTYRFIRQFSTYT